MTSYPFLKRGLAAGLSLVIVGVAVFFVMRQTNLATENDKGQGDLGGLLLQRATGDWTMFGGTPSRNMANTVVTGLPAKWDVDTKMNIKWAASLGSKAYGGPIVAGGRVFIGTNNQNPRNPKDVKPVLDKDGKQVVVNGVPKTTPIDLGVVMCFDEKKGDFQWQVTFNKLPGGQVVDWPLEGICSSPAVEGDKLYYVSNRCEVVCADVNTGKEIWKLDMIGKLGVFPHNLADCSPLLVGDHLWVVTSNGVNEDHISVPSPKAPSFIKVEKKTGDVGWQDNSPSAQMLAAGAQANQANFLKNLVNRGQLIQHGQWANPAYGVVNGQPQVIFPGGDGWIYAFDPKAKTGDAPIWKFDCNPKDSKYELSGKGTRNDFIGTPVVHKNRVYIGVGQDPEHRTGVGHFWCIDMTKEGDVSPDLVTDNEVFPPKTKPNPNSAAVWHYGGVIEDKDLVRKLRRNYYFGRTMSTAAIHEDICYIADLGGVLHALDANTGKLHWEHDTKADIWGSPYYADGKVFLGTDDALWVFQHGAKKQEPHEFDMGGRCRATPIAANGVLYVMTENKLFAIAK